MGKPAATIVTVKAMPEEAWAMAKAACARSGETMGEWLARAIRQLAERERGERVLPPEPVGMPAAFARESAPVRPLDLGGLEAAMRAAHAVSEASGVPVPKTAARHAFALLTAELRQARGLPPVKPRQTLLQIGQTAEELGHS